MALVIQKSIRTNTWEIISLSLSLKHTVLAIALDGRASFDQEFMPEMQRKKSKTPPSE